MTTEYGSPRKWALLYRVVFRGICMIACSAPALSCYLGDQIAGVNVRLAFDADPHQTPLSPTSANVTQALLVIDKVLGANRQERAKLNIPFPNDDGNIIAQYTPGTGTGAVRCSVYLHGAVLEVSVRNTMYGSRLSTDVRNIVESLKRELREKFGEERVACTRI